MTTAGQLRHRVKVQELVSGRDDRGNPINEWQTVATLWASVEGLSGSQYFAAQQTVQQSDHRIIIRYRKDIKPGMRVLHDGRAMEVHAVLDKTGRREWLELMCRELVA